ncbi:MAG: phosphate ABC transporter, permease protein PstA [Candidatus Schekmanbacteria bacterium RIFCSPHIGHO2_02_FULL_38_11]|nr:MAG: phosphate ABC transporter, permease protein PstA [Candidatus Schekmanbacteria bacterium RIFCSPHIGHO2_02_FULL_38_11]
MNNLRYKRRKMIQKVMFFFSVASAFIGIAFLFLILGYVIYKGAGGINIDFFTKLPTPVGVPGGGMANALIGSFYLVGLASLFSIPVGILTGVYLSEFGRGLFASAVRFMAETLTGVPSIIIGIFAYSVVVISMGRFSAFAGAFALSILMLPIITKSTEEILRMVPESLREASLALGIPRWKTILKVVLSTAKSGIITGIMLAIARVGGEAAPLLFTAFGNSYMNWRPDQPIASLPVQLYVYAISPYEDWHTKAWAAALVLIGIVLMTNIMARIYAGSK